MNIKESGEIILSLNDMLSIRMKKYIHYRSIRNFVIHFDEIQNKLAQEKIENLLSEFVEEIKVNDYEFEGSSSFGLARKYVFKISPYYREYSNFMVLMTIQVSILFGLFGDTLLYFTKIPSLVRHIPIITIGFLLYYFFVRVFKVPKFRAYGLFY